MPKVRKRRKTTWRRAKRYTGPAFRHLPRSEGQEDWGDWEYLAPEEMRAWVDEAFKRKDMFAHVEIVWVNKVYVVIGARLEVDPWGSMIHLYIFRQDNKPIRSWVDLQQIKNEIVDPSCTAIEVFPPEDEKVDELNWYHLWVLPPGRRLPFWMGNARPEGIKYYIPGILVESQEAQGAQHKVKTYTQLKDNDGRNSRTLHGKPLGEETQEDGSQEEEENPGQEEAPQEEG